MVDVTFDAWTVERQAAVKLQGEGWELNVRAAPEEFARLRGIEHTDWAARRTLTVGTCAGVPVHWCSAAGEATILVGADDETWDFSVAVPVRTVRKIADLAERWVRDFPAGP